MKRRSSLAGEPRQERERRRLPPGVPRSREPRSNPPGVPRSRETRLPRGVPRSPDCRCWGPRPDSLCARPRALARAASKGAPAITSLQNCGLYTLSVHVCARPLSWADAAQAPGVQVSQEGCSNTRAPNSNLQPIIPRAHRLQISRVPYIAHRLLI